MKLSTRRGRLVVRDTGLSLAELRASYTRMYGWLESTTGGLPQSMVEKPTRPSSVIRAAKRDASYAVPNSPRAAEAAQMSLYGAIGQRAHARFYSRLEAR